MSRKDQQNQPHPVAPRAPSLARLWLFRLIALVLAPTLTLGALEATLRLAGFGYSARFLVPTASNGWATNPDFGQRFFPRHLARSPVPFEIEATAADDRPFRIFVVGGSAARGTPDSAYSFGRVLERMLEEVYPEVEIEVANTAMTAINSHVALPIVRDLAVVEPDLFVVYLGNNEVVGPYGAGSVFRDLAGLRAIRAGIGLRSFRMGQLLDRWLTLASSQQAPRRWTGMEMFLERQIAADDPRLETVYAHFDRNLRDIVAAADSAGARSLLVTVATNLRHQPPFASLERADLSDVERERWRALYDQGLAAVAAGHHQEAVERFQAAAEIDDGHAELHFHLGHARLGLGRAAAAEESFVRARDLDALRFRADSRIQEVIRRVASEETERGAGLLDAAQALAAASPNGLPGNELLYEHVHLRFPGNYALARLVLKAIADLLPPRIAERATRAPPPSLERVAELLALSPFDEFELEQDILALVSRPPFTGQSGHRELIETHQQRIAALRRGLTPDVWRATEALYRRQLELRPDDIELRRRFATRLQAQGLGQAAADQWRTLTERFPEILDWQGQLANSLADSGRVSEGVAKLRELVRREPTSAPLHVNLGTLLEKKEHWNEAIQHYQRALEIDPGELSAAFNLGRAWLEQGEIERAVHHFEQLVAERPDFARAHHHLGYAYEQQGKRDLAIQSYRRAIAAEPSFAEAHNSLGLVLESAGQRATAAEHFRAAIRWEPDFALARFNLADLLFATGELVEAETQYRQGLLYAPSNVQARTNRATLLQHLGQAAAAVAEFQRVLEARPDDPGALTQLARIFATARDLGVRDAGQAVTLAERAAAVTDRQSPEILETLATAYMAAGRPADAAASLEDAVKLAQASGDQRLANALTQRLAIARSRI